MAPSMSEVFEKGLVIPVAKLLSLWGAGTWWDKGNVK